MTAQQSIWQPDSNSVSLVDRRADPTTFTLVIGDGRWQWQPAPGRGPLEEQHVVTRLHEVPEPGELAHIEKTGPPEWREDAQVRFIRMHWTAHQTIASGQRKRTVRARQAV